MGLIVKHSDGSEFLNIANKTYDETSTSLKLPGKGVLNWGEAYVNNFIHLLENFASSYEPRNPQIGQLWYNTGNGQLSVFTIAQEWEIVNKDTDIETKFDELVERLEASNAAPIPPSDAVPGTTWFDTNDNTLKVYNGSEWISFSISSSVSYIQPSNPNVSDLWFDKNVTSMKIYDGSDFQRLFSTIESPVQPADVSLGQFWTDTTTNKIYVYKQDQNNQYFWQELGSDEVTEGDILPTTAKVGALHIIRKSGYNILYINKGSKTDPIWTEIPEFGGAISSVNEPIRVVDGMFWLDGNNVLKIRKNGVWVDIDETALSFISDTIPDNPKDGMIWFDTSIGEMKVNINNAWTSIQNKGIITFGDSPISPSEGQLWYDNIEGKLKIFNGSEWSSVNSSATIVGYTEPSNTANGQFWLDTTTSELKVNKDGRWAAIPEKARANLIYPANPKNGDIVYVNDKLQVFDGNDWKNINVQIDNSVTGSEVSINYDEISHEIVITNNGVIERVPLAVNRDVIVENVGITSDIIEVIHPDIADGERRIVNIQKVNLNRPFFVFKNGAWTDNYKIDNQDLVIFNANGEDEIVLVQINGDVSTKFNVKKFRSNVYGNFTIDNYTRTIEEEDDYNIIKAEYDTKLAELIANHGENSSEEDLTDEEWEILKEIESRFPIKTSNQIADLSLGSIMVLKEGVFIPNDVLTINADNDNKIVIPNTNAGEIYTIIQLVAGDDYKTSFFMKEYSFQIGATEDNTESTQLNVKGKMMSDMLSMASKNTAEYGEIDVSYTFDTTNKTVTFDLLDIDTNFNIFVTRNNLYVPAIKYTIDNTNNTLTMAANDKDNIRIFQFYLPHNFVPVEFNYAEVLAKANGWVTLELNNDFDLSVPLLVFRNGMLQENSNINIITEETITDDNGNTYTVSGLRKVQVFGDQKSNNESVPGILEGDLITVMQVSQSENYNVYLEEFSAMTDGYNIFNLLNINTDKKLIVFQNGMKLCNNEYSIDTDGKLIINNCNGPTTEELSIDPNSKGDTILVFQFIPKVDIEELSYTVENIVATTNGAEYFQLQNTKFVEDEFLLVFKNGMLLTRRQPENESTTQTQINTYQVFAERVYHSQTPALDANGDPIYDSEGNPVMNVDPNDYSDIMAFSIDNVIAGEEIEIFEFNKQVTLVNNLSTSDHYEILPLNNIQRIYTSKFDQISNLTMVFQDGLLIDRMIDDTGNDTTRVDGMLRVLDQYAVDDISKSIIVSDWKVGGKIRIHQFTAQDKDIQTITLSLTVAADGTFDVFLPNNETYTPNTGAIEIYVDRVIQWSGEDYQEVANNRVLFTKPLNKDQSIKMIIRK